MSGWKPIPYFGSFQGGRLQRSSDPLEAVWRSVERAGTVDNLTRIATSKGYSPSAARPASLKIRQALELRRAAQSASILTRPLLLYYSMLNMTRGFMCAYTGSAGKPRHGLSYSGGASLLECRARADLEGTFGTFARSIGAKDADIKALSISLRDLFSLIPELYNDFPLLGAGQSSVVPVRINAYRDAPMTLRFYVPDKSPDEFEAQWKSMFHWFAEYGEITAAYTISLHARPGPDMVEKFCKTYLFHDLRRREDALWYDHRADTSVTTLNRTLAYVASMFILSNVSRYEPEFLEAPTAGLNDLGYFLGAFLENAERFFPQLMLEIINGHPVFFE